MTLFLKDTNFIINCAARTGSTFLLHLLRSNPQIMMHGEVITPDGCGALTGIYGKKKREYPEFVSDLNSIMETDPKRFVYDLIFDKQGRRVVGFKYKTDEFFDPRFRSYSNIFIEDKSIKIINLTRNNILDQYVSHQVVLHQTGTTLVKSDDEIPEISPFLINIDHVLAYFKDVISREQKSIEIYGDHRRIDVLYEDVRTEGHKIRDEVQEFLDVKTVELSSPTKKIIKDNFKLINNLEEVKAALVSNGYESRIE